VVQIPYLEVLLLLVADLDQHGRVIHIREALAVQVEAVHTDILFLYRQQVEQEHQAKEITVVVD
jgi:hypothetical protein